MKLIKKAMLAVVTFVLALVAFVAPVRHTQVEAADTPTVLYLAPSSDWKQANARFAAYFFGNGETWVSMNKLGDNLYGVAVPTETVYPKVIFCRMNPDASANNWNNRWNQTGDLAIPTDGKNLFTVPNGKWDGATTTWSKIVPSVVGSHNSWDVANGSVLTFNSDFNRYETKEPIELPADSEWKLVFNNSWDYNIGGTYSKIDESLTKYCTIGKDNITVHTTGKYYIWFDNSLTLGMEEYVEPTPEPEYPLSPVVAIGTQVGVAEESQALRIIVKLDLTEEQLENYESTIAIRVTKEGSAGEINHEVKTLYTTINPMTADGQILTDAYYAVLTLTNIPNGSYNIEVLVDGELCHRVTASVPQE